MTEDLFGRMGNGVKHFVTTFFPWLWHTVRAEWIRYAILIVSSTQTYGLLKFFAPSWAFWLPAAGVGLMELSSIFWFWREATANAIERGGEEVKLQERLANSMIWLCLGMSGVTMIAGAFLEVTSSQLSVILHPNPQVTAFLGWAAIVGIFLLGVTELVVDWQYRRADPTLEMERQHRAAHRRLLQQKRQVELKNETSVMSQQNAILDKRYQRMSRHIARLRANAEFTSKTSDVLKKPRRVPARAKKKTRK